LTHFVLLLLLLRIAEFYGNSGTNDPNVHCFLTKPLAKDDWETKHGKEIFGATGFKVPYKPRSFLFGLRPKTKEFRRITPPMPHAPITLQLELAKNDYACYFTKLKSDNLYRISLTDIVLTLESPIFTDLGKNLIKNTKLLFLEYPCANLVQRNVYLNSASNQTCEWRNIIMPSHIVILRILNSVTAGLDAPVHIATATGQHPNLPVPLGISKLTVTWGGKKFGGSETTIFNFEDDESKLQRYLNNREAPCIGEKTNPILRLDHPGYNTPNIVLQFRTDPRIGTLGQPPDTEKAAKDISNMTMDIDTTGTSDDALNMSFFYSGNTVLDVRKGLIYSDMAKYDNQ
jgi:hypothetical protein